jgi:hypothetical protein
MRQDVFPYFVQILLGCSLHKYNDICQMFNLSFFPALSKMNAFLYMSLTPAINLLPVTMTPLTIYRRCRLHRGEHFIAGANSNDIKKT